MALLDLTRAELAHPLAGGERAGEGHQVDTGMSDQGFADLAAEAVHDIHRAARQSGESAREIERRQRRLFGRLDDDGIAGGEGRRHLPRQQQQGVVPRHNRGDDAVRLLDREVDLVRRHWRNRAAARVAPDLGVIVETGRRPLDLVMVLAVRFAALAGHRSGKLTVALAHPPGDLVQKASLLDAGQEPPALERRPRRAHGAVGILRRAARDAVQHLSGRGVEDRDGAAPAGGLPSVDPMRSHAFSVRQKRRPRSAGRRVEARPAAAPGQKVKLTPPVKMVSSSMPRSSSTSSANDSCAMTWKPNQSLTCTGTSRPMRASLRSPFDSSRP